MCHITHVYEKNFINCNEHEIYYISNLESDAESNDSMSKYCNNNDREYYLRPDSSNNSDKDDCLSVEDITNIEFEYISHLRSVNSCAIDLNKNNN